jgi:hypothetical protein
MKTYEQAFDEQLTLDVVRTHAKPSEGWVPGTPLRTMLGFSDRHERRRQLDVELAEHRAALQLLARYGETAARGMAS